MSLSRHHHIGLLILRLGIGTMFMYHGYGKLFSGPEQWEKIGSAMNYLGVHSIPQVFGLLAALSEFVGGLCIILGLFFRPACLFLLFTMMIAAVMHLNRGDGLKVASHAIEAGILFFSLIFIGPGNFSLDKRFAT